MAKELTLMAVGDVFVGPVREASKKAPGTPIIEERSDLFSWFSKVAPILQQGDFTMGNCEGPICEGGQSDISKAGTGGRIFKMPPRAAAVMKKVGFNILALANNHDMDMGAEGLLETMKHLDEAGIARAGGGRDIAEARKPAIVERGGVRLAFLSYTSTFVPGTSPAGEHKPGLATVAVSTAYEVTGNIHYAPGVPPRIITTPDRGDAERMLEDVRQAKANADIVVVSHHWGTTRFSNSYALKISLDEAPFFVANYQEDLGRAAIDAGADLIMGHHPHQLQGMEIYKGKLICYSLGNLVLSWGDGPNFGTETVILKGMIDPKLKQIKRFTLVPLIAPRETLEPFPATPGQAGDHIKLLTRLSRKYGTKFRMDGAEIAVEAA